MADTDTTPPLDVSALEPTLSGTLLGHPIVYFPAIESTNTHALALAREGAAEGTLVTTDDQTAGRGRVGRRWVSLPFQQLSLSLVLKPHFPPNFLVMASALSVVAAIQDTAPSLHPSIKWPNDVLVEARKVCGILIETSGEHAVLGIGLNVNGSLDAYPDVSTRATTLASALGHPLSREAVATSLLKHLDAYYARLQTGGETAQGKIRAEWRARLVTLGTAVTIRQGDGMVEGIAEDVDADGTLLVRGSDGTLQPITWGDVE